MSSSIIKAIGIGTGIGIAAALLLNSFARAAEPPKASYSTAEQEQLLLAAGNVGALMHCEMKKIYETPTTGRAYSRLRVIFKQPNLSEEMQVLGGSTYAVLVQAGRAGVAIEKQGAQLMPVEIKGPEDCKAAAKRLEPLMAPGAVLDVPVPNEPAA